MSEPRGVIAVAGEALVDLVPAGPPDQFHAAPGGSPANVAVGLARLGVPARMLARIGADLLGRRIRKHLSSNGIDLDHAVAATEPSSLALVDLAPDGGADYDFRIGGTADWQWTDRELATALDGNVVALHTGSLALVLPPGADALMRLVTRAECTISYDPNCRPLLTDRADMLARVERMLPLADIVKASAEDLAWLYPGRAVEDALREWVSRGPAVVVLTLGGDGAIGMTAEGAEPVRCPGRAVRVVDTVGAGDAFTAGLLAGFRRRDLLGAARRNALRALGNGEFGAVLEEAALIAAITCTRRGADPPTLAELGR
ncbi:MULTISPECIES: carbohydrate kinase [unclassified Nocardia]|uniref:carbohydrate kinase family protein n=1 Tax=unclassified Nocardia TaxID=2637762 RepID=UPI001CE4A3BD|nr:MULTISPECIES: carbohydrate kinase [unclassified Nocardia]